MKSDSCRDLFFSGNRKFFEYFRLSCLLISVGRNRFRRMFLMVQVVLFQEVFVLFVIFLNKKNDFFEDYFFNFWFVF